MRGYFAIGIDRVSKSGNMGNLVRTAHGFGAAFAFAIDPKGEAMRVTASRGRTPDTAKSAGAMPFYEYASVDELRLPKGCRLVGIEITDDAIELPSFKHPKQAAYVLGSERLSLSDEVAGRCDFMIKIPTKFSLNVATAGAIVMYDRQISMGRFARRGVTPSAEPEALPEHVRGGPVLRNEKNV